MIVTCTSAPTLTFKRRTMVHELWIKQTVLVLVALLVVNTVAVSQVTKSEQASRSAKVKAEVQRRGIGQQSRVRVKLVSRSEVKGYISKIEDTSFEVTDKNSGQTTTISYSNVDRLKGSGLPTIAKIGIVVGAAVLIVALVIGVSLKRAGY